MNKRDIAVYKKKEAGCCYDIHKKEKLKNAVVYIQKMDILLWLWSTK